MCLCFLGLCWDTGTCWVHFDLQEAVLVQKRVFSGCGVEDALHIAYFLLNMHLMHANHVILITLLIIQIFLLHTLLYLPSKIIIIIVFILALLIVNS